MNFTTSVKRKLKKNLLKIVGEMEILAKKGDIVDTFRSNGNLHVKVDDCVMMIWEWEIDETFEDESLLDERGGMADSVDYLQDLGARPK